MQKFLSILALTTFVLIMQMPFIHALDMGMGHSISAMGQILAPEHDGALCNENATSSTKSCFLEIPESKWVEGMKKTEIIPFIFLSFFVFFAVFSLNTFESRLNAFFKQRIFYQDTLYLGLYGIIRNVN